MHTAPLILVPLVGFAALALAEPPAAVEGTPESAPAALEDDGRDPVVTLTLSGSYATQSDLDVGPGDVRVARAGVELGITFPIADRRALSLTVSSEESFYDFNGATGLAAGGEPFSDVNQSDLSLFYTAPIDDTTSYFVLGSVGFAGETGADFGDSIVYGGGLGFSVRASDTLTWGLGVAVFSRLEDDALIVPLPQIRWAISDRWTLATQGAGARLMYRASEALSYGVSAEFVSDTFRLDDTGPLPGFVATDRRVPVAFVAEYHASPSVTVTAQAGAALFANFELLNASGVKVTDDDVDAGVMLGLSGRVRF